MLDGSWLALALIKAMAFPWLLMAAVLVPAFVYARHDERWGLTHPEELERYLIRKKERRRVLWRFVFRKRQ